MKKIIDERDDLEKKKNLTKLNYQSNLSTLNGLDKGLDKDQQSKDSIDYNSNSLSIQNNQLNHKKAADDILIFRSAKDNLAFRLE